MDRLIDEILAIYKKIDKGEIEEEEEARKEIAIVFGKAIRWNLEEGMKQFRESIKVPMVEIDLTEKAMIRRGDLVLEEEIKALNKKAKQNVIRESLEEYFGENAEWNDKKENLLNKIVEFIPDPKIHEDMDCVLLNLDGFSDIPLKSQEVKRLIAELCRQGKCKIAVRWDWSVPHIFVNGKEIK